MEPLHIQRANVEDLADLREAVSAEELTTNPASLRIPAQLGFEVDCLQVAVRPSAGVRLTGRLVCSTHEQADTVRQHLPLHLSLTRAEAGCESFDVTPTPDPMVWLVSEQFSDAASLEAHQRRVAASDWGRATAEIAREYEIRGLQP